MNLDGTVSPRTERFVISWFSTFGRFSSIKTLLDEQATFTAATGSGIDQPPAGADPYEIWLAAVVRDGRGGEGWILRNVLVPRP